MRCGGMLRNARCCVGVRNLQVLRKFEFETPAQEKKKIAESEEAIARRRKIVSELALRSKAVALQVGGPHCLLCWLLEALWPWLY